MVFKFEELIQHLRSHGFFFQNSEIYGGLLNSWDYGPLATEMKIKIKKIWWNNFVNNFENNYGLDSSILMNSKVWNASGHISNFSDLLIDCKNCKFRFRPDKLIESKTKEKNVEKLNPDSIDLLLIKNKIKCPKCNKMSFTNTRKFDLMFKVQNGILEKEKENNLYLRPETAQGIFINFKNIERTMSAKLPFGVCQIGKSFRNEITPSNFIFRTREFEQMELEFFYSKYDKNKWFEFWIKYIEDFLKYKIKLNSNNIIKKEYLKKEELSHYSRKTVDFEYKFPFGVGELWGISDRGDFDLSSHQKYSNHDLRYFDIEKKEKYHPYVIEPSVGIDRLLLAILCDSFKKETINNKERIFLKINKNLSPIQICILPLMKKKELIIGSEKILNDLKNLFTVKISVSGSIGKRYVKQDSIGTPFCVTYDFNSLEDKKVTIRDRDTTLQSRINIDDLKTYFLNQFN